MPRNGVSTVDETLVNGFDHLAKDVSWWADSNNNKMIHMLVLNKARIPYIIDRIIEYGDIHVKDTSKPLEGLTILDVGCGCGLLAEPLAQLGADVTGIDPAKTAIERATEHAKLDASIEGRLKYRTATIENFSATNNGQYDVVVSAHVIDFVVNPSYFLGMCCAKVKPGGIIYIEAKNRNMTTLIGGLWREYVSKKVQRGLYPWRKQNKPEEVLQILKKNGFYNFKTVGQQFNRQSKMFEISSNLGGAYSVTAKKEF